MNIIKIKRHVYQNSNNVHIFLNESILNIIYITEKKTSITSNSGLIHKFITVYY